MHQRECNWFQSLEGDIDTSHFGFLHVGGVKMEDVDPTTINRWAVGDRAPDYKSTETEWGTMYAAYRPADAGQPLLSLRPLHVPVHHADPERLLRGPDRVHPERADG